MARLTKAIAAPQLVVIRLALPVIFAAFILPVQSACCQYQEEQTVQAATEVLKEAMGTSLKQIPQSMLSGANGVAIIPNVIKGGFVLGARHGRGLLFVREPGGVWHAPVFITLTGGNIGWQAGIQSSDIVLVFKTPQSIQGILSGKLTIGADAAAAAGPVGRQGSIATDGQLKAEIYSYSRSRGLFAGVSVDGSVVQVDSLATGAYYRSPGPGQPVIVPMAAQQLTQTIANYADSNLDPATLQQHAGLAEQHRATEPDLLRNQLIQLAPRLYGMLDEPWQAFLALPPSVLSTDSHPAPAEFANTLQHFESVASAPQYQDLAARPEFQSVHGLLKQYQQSLAESVAKLQLPPPPPLR